MQRIGVLFLTLYMATWLGVAWGQSPVSLRGRVTAGGNPLEGAYVGAHAAGKTFTKYVMTDRNGNFSFRGLAAGNYGVFTQIPGFRTAHKNSIPVQAGNPAVASSES